MIINQSALTVSQLNQRIRLWLEHDIGPVSVEGEISNLSKPASGHFYFTLKDSGAQIRCVYFRNRLLSNPKMIPEHGQHIIAHGTLSLYEARGDYQLIINTLEEIGSGDLYHQFEQLKEKLSKEGLFDSNQKKTLPKLPHTIGIISSPTAAALKDILTTLERRFPLCSIVIYPSDVQGKDAPHQLIAAIQRATHDNRCDVLLLARGGGSLEDLWAFNDENLARAIYKSTLPIVSGIGHETDITIADFVADLRAATPTAAAEAVSPDQTQLYQHCTQLIERINHNIKRRLQSSSQTLDYQTQHLNRAIKQLVMQKKHQINTTQQMIESQHPTNRILIAREKLNSLSDNLIHIIQKQHFKAQEKLKTTCATLHAISPLATLDRGYSIAMYHSHVLMDSNAVKIGDSIELKLSKGQLTCIIQKREPHD